MKKSLFIDSGAYSAFSKNVEIVLQEYIDFIKHHHKCIDVYANLDVIGDAEKTLVNQKIMEEQGLHPLPCYHIGEDIKYLKYYMDNYDYIAIGGMVNKSGKTDNKRDQYLDYLFSRFICNDRKIPKVKVHGFGLTSVRLIVRYPWYSVDSTTWVRAAGMGQIYIPNYIDGEWNYLQNIRICISTLERGGSEPCFFPGLLNSFLNYKGMKLGKSKFKKVPQNYKKKKRERWVNREEGIVEIIIERGVSNCSGLRSEINIDYFNGLQSALGEWPRTFSPSRKYLF